MAFDAQTPDKSAEELASRLLCEARDVLARFIAEPAQIARIANAAGAISAMFRAGGKILACGNGGSAADAMHFCEELTGRFRHNRPALPAMSLLDPTHITCVANDFGFEHVFSRMVEAHGREGDCLVVLTTSGNSPNILRGVEAARARAITTIAFLGRDGGQLRGVCDHEILVPAQSSERIQEVHMVVLHTLVELIERAMFGERTC